MLRAATALLLAAMAMPAAAQTIVVSENTENISLTVYRAPARGEAPINKNWPQGYALITETRTVQIPAGESIIRFEGVAEGMFPESAIVTGLPQGVREKNRDARLLSPAGLVDAYLKREVTIRRTNRASGKVTESEAIITTGPNGVILNTGDGFEALSCSGMPERMIYGQVPNNLSAKPTLSVITQSDRAVTAQLTLTYMSGGFDWEANYLVQMSDDASIASPNKDDAPKDKASLFAWLTLANGGNQSFNNANTMAIAGEPNRERRKAEPRPTGGALQLKCWPIQRTDQVPYRGLHQFPGAIPAPSRAMSVIGEDALDEIIISASRRSRKQAAPLAVMKAVQENLGDLKLYRVPERVNVNANGQKQVAMITQPDAVFERLFIANVNDFGEESAPMAIMLRGKNDKEGGLGLPMPSGQVQLFEPSSYGPLLAGETTLNDRAVGQKIELIVGRASDVRMTVTKLSEKKRKQKWRVKLSNARTHDARVEIELPNQLSGRRRGIRKIDGVPTWIGIIPANEDVTFDYTVKLAKTD